MHKVECWGEGREGGSRGRCAGRPLSREAGYVRVYQGEWTGYFVTMEGYRSAGILLFLLLSTTATDSGVRDVKSLFCCQMIACRGQGY